MAEPFITGAELGTYLELGDLSADPVATIATEAACAICRTFADQEFTSTAGDIVSLDGAGTDALLLPEYPVTDVSAVSVDDSAVTDWVVSPIGVLIRPGSYWPAGRQNITVTYDHGYAEADFPADVRMVALVVAGRLYDRVDAKQESLGAYSATYVTNATDLTIGEKAILRKHRRT
jgi:hypothetical protein